MIVSEIPAPAATCRPAGERVAPNSRRGRNNYSSLIAVTNTGDALKRGRLVRFQIFSMVLMPLQELETRTASGCRALMH